MSNQIATSPTASKLARSTAANVNGYLRDLRHALDQVWRLVEDPAEDALALETMRRCFREGHQMLSLAEAELDDLPRAVEAVERAATPIARLQLHGRDLLVEARGHLVVVTENGATRAHGFLSSAGHLRVEHSDLDFATMAAVEAVAAGAEGGAISLDFTHDRDTPADVREALDRERLARFAFGSHEVEVSAPAGGTDGAFEVRANGIMVADGLIAGGKVDDLSEETYAPAGVVELAMRLVEASLAKKERAREQRSA